MVWIRVRGGCECVCADRAACLGVSLRGWTLSGNELKIIITAQQPVEVQYRVKDVFIQKDDLFLPFLYNINIPVWICSLFNLKIKIFITELVTF